MAFSYREFRVWIYVSDESAPQSETRPSETPSPSPSWKRQSGIVKTVIAFFSPPLRYFFCNALRGQLRIGRYENRVFRRPSAGGSHQGFRYRQRWRGRLLPHQGAPQRCRKNSKLQVHRSNHPAIFTYAQTLYRIHFIPVFVAHANYGFPSHSTRLLASSTLRTVLGTRSLAEILSERETISHTMQTSLDEATDPWGVKVERVEM